MPRKATRAKDRQLPILERLPGHIGLPLGHSGRRTIYEAGLCPRAHKLALLGLTDEEIAELWNVSLDAFRDWKRKHPEFRHAVESAKIPADAEVAASAYKRATGYEIDAVKIFLNPETKEPIYAHYQEHYPADVTAASFWLRNRQPHLWQDRREMNMTGSIEHRVANMSREERRARLLELHSKAAEVLFAEDENGAALVE